MGHKSIEMTVRYSHPAPKHILAAVERLAAPASSAESTSNISGSFDLACPFRLRALDQARDGWQPPGYGTFLSLTGIPESPIIIGLS